jgi:hypothetical protein
VAFIRNDWRSVKIDLIVDHKKRIVCIHNIIVDWDTVEILFKQVLEELVFFLERCFLLLYRQLVKMHLIVSLVEVV